MHWWNLFRPCTCIPDPDHHTSTSVFACCYKVYISLNPYIKECTASKNFIILYFLSQEYLFEDLRDDPDIWDLLICRFFSAWIHFCLLLFDHELRSELSHVGPFPCCSFITPWISCSWSHFGLMTTCGKFLHSSIFSPLVENGSTKSQRPKNYKKSPLCAEIISLNCRYIFVILE